MFRHRVGGFFSFIYLGYHFLKVSAFFEKIALFLKVLLKSCFYVWGTVSLRPRFRDGTERGLGHLFEIDK